MVAWHWIGLGWFVWMHTIVSAPHSFIKRDSHHFTSFYETSDSLLPPSSSRPSRPVSLVDPQDRYFYSTHKDSLSYDDLAQEDVASPLLGEETHVCQSMKPVDNCNPLACYMMVHMLQQLNEQHDYTDKSKAQLIIDIWGETHDLDEHSECILETLRIARTHHFILPSHPLELPNCPEALKDHPECQAEACEALVTMYHSFNDHQDHHLRYQIPVSTLFHTKNVTGSTCYQLSLNQVKVAGLSLEIPVPSETGVKTYPFL